MISDFAFGIGPGAHSPCDDCLPQFIIWLDVSQRVINRQAQFPVLEHDASVLIRFADLGQFRSEERVAIEKDGRQPEDGAVFFAELLDGLPDDRQVGV